MFKPELWQSHDEYRTILRVKALLIYDFEFWMITCSILCTFILISTPFSQ